LGGTGDRFRPILSATRPQQSFQPFTVLPATNFSVKRPYEFFINRLRHPYARRSMLSAVDEQSKQTIQLFPGFAEGETMLDLIFIAATLAFFLLSLAYVRGCEKLQ